MGALTRQKCMQIRDRIYPPQERPGILHQAAVAREGGPGRALLEIGCGREAKLLRRMAAHFATCIGMDVEVSEAARGDDSIRMIQGDAHAIPLEDACVDVVSMKNAVEHFADPVRVFRECARVLRPGGRVIILTVNQWFPPILLARGLPHAARQRINRIVSGTADQDTFPTHYRANSARSLRTAAAAAGLRVAELRYLTQHPQYMMFSVLAYRLGIAMERMLRWDALAGWRHFIHAVLEKADDRQGSRVRVPRDRPGPALRGHARAAGSTWIAESGDE